MITRTFLQRKSALSENIKMSSLTQEVIRRMLNCCELAENSGRVESLNNLAVKMCTSGYDTRYIRKVFVAGIKGYEKKLENSRKPHTDPKYKPLHPKPTMLPKGWIRNFRQRKTGTDRARQMKRKRKMWRWIK